MNRTKEEWASWLPFEHSEIIAQQDIAELWARNEALEAEVARFKSINIQRIDECLSLAQERDALLAQVEAFGDVVALALPYVECAEDDPCYKPGAVRKIVEKMRAVIEQLEQTK